MIPYIDQRLHEWAAWSWISVDGFRGGGQFGYDEPMPRVAAYVTLGETQDRCIETEEGVAWLQMESYRLGSVVILHYRQHPNWSGEMQAQFLRISRTTLWRFLDKSHALLLGYWLDRAVGLCPQTEQLRLAKRVRNAILLDQD